MRKPILFLLITLSLSPGLHANRIVAAVNGRAVLESEVKELYQSRELEIRRRATDKKQAEAEIAKVWDETLQTLIDQELILKEYEPYKATFDSKVKNYAEEAVKTRFIAKMFNGDREKFLKELSLTGISYKKFFEQQKRNVVAEMMRGQNARPESSIITEEDKQEYIRKHSEEFRLGGKIKLWAITINGTVEGSTTAGQLALAKEVRAKLLKGDDFASLARTYSQDSKRAEGGNRGWLEQRDLPQPMWVLVSKLKAGTVSEVTPFAGDFYIFWVEAAQPGQMKPADQVNAEVEKRIDIERRTKAGEEWLKKLRKKANIEIK